MSTASFYKWRSKYGGMDAAMISQMQALEDENLLLKKMYAEMSMQAELLNETLGKNDAAISTPRAGRESSGVDNQPIHLPKQLAHRVSTGRQV